MKLKELPGGVRLIIAVGVLAINMVLWLVLPEKIYDRFTIEVDLVN